MAMLITWELPDNPVSLGAWWRVARDCGALRELPTRPGERAYAQRVERAHYDRAIEALVCASVPCIAVGIPSLLTSRAVSYAHECCGETWRAWPVLHARGTGDCDDLSAAHAAWLRVHGDPGARAQSEATGAPTDFGGVLYHFVTVTGRGERIDVARALGMSPNSGCDITGPCGDPCRNTSPAY